MPFGGYILTPRFDNVSYRWRCKTGCQVDVNELSGLVSGSSFLAEFVCNHTKQNTNRSKHNNKTKG